MKILSMMVENFLSFGKARFDFDDQGLVLVEGDNQDDESARSNGSGKSAMIDALVWCLFGTTLRGYENDEVVNRKVGEDCVVVVRISPSDLSVAYEVTRFRKHKKSKNMLVVAELDQGGDSTDMSKPSTSETQEVIDHLLGCSKRTFLSSVVFGQDRAYRFSSLTDKEQKEILDEVLGVERFAAACSTARAQAAVISAAVDLVTQDMERAEEARDNADAEAVDLRKKDKQYTTERGEKVAVEHEKLNKAKAWLKKNEKIDTVKLKAAHEKALKVVTATEAEVDSKTSADARAKAALSSGKAKADEIWTHVLRHEQLVGDCPTCKQQIDEKMQGKLLKGLRKQHADLQLAYINAEEAAKEIAFGLAEAKKKLKEARSNVMVAQQAVSDGLGAEAEVISWRRRAADHEARIKELKAEENPYTALVKKAETRYEKHRKECELLVTQHEAERARLKLAEFWVKAFGARGLRSLLLDSSLPLLNQEADRVSRALTGGTIAVEFSATSDLKSGKTIDRFEVKVDNKHGAGSYQGNSAGEKAKVDLCVGLALQKLVASRSSTAFNVAFLDEVFDHLDSAAHERVIEVLSEIDKESVLVVSHNEDLKAFFPNVLTIVKKDGFSSVEK